MPRYTLAYNDDGTFTATYDGFRWIEVTSDSAAQALEEIQDLVEMEDTRAEVSGITVSPGDQSFYGGGY